MINALIIIVAIAFLILTYGFMCEIFEQHRDVIRMFLEKEKDGRNNEMVYDMKDAVALTDEQLEKIERITQGQLGTKTYTDYFVITSENGRLVIVLGSLSGDADTALRLGREKAKTLADIIYTWIREEESK